MASIARRPDGTYRPRFRDASGKEHARHFKRKVDAQRWLDEQTAALVRGDWVDPMRGRCTFRVYVSTWLPAQPLRDTSRRTYDSYLRNHLLPAFGDRGLSAVTRTQVLGFRRGIEDKLSPTTSRQVMALLASVFTDAVEDGFLVKSPCRETLPPRPHRERVVPLTVEQVEALVAAAPDRYRALVVLGAGCGLRLGEALGLKVGRVRFLERELDVVEQLTLVPGAPPKLGPPKTRRSIRTVPLADVVSTALAEHLAAFPAGPNDLVFRSRTGGPVWPNTFNGAVWQPLRRRAGLPAARFHDLRHFTASALIRYGESVKTVAHVLGHADETETLRTYSHLWPDAETRTRAAIEVAFARPADSVRTEGLAHRP
ncbi:tyrosine-type recombinase/integrase [Trujillonella endophytica]|uniref:Site-specific recombinase XerD n=1 Tax=Trujillonella endophytica TaxID=673521 RepID=A0A1H8S9Z2_9ACTN|nr:site-specific integrase [Trujillella endophytica]SEO75415.1 Site-specific recombinase XerD [Trujillella endophytica]